MLNAQDLEQLRKLGIREAEVQEQLKSFQDGIPALSIVRPATRGDGIQVLSESSLKNYAELYEKNVERPGRAMKFVPASGEATRMFQVLLKYFHERPEDWMQPDPMVEDFFKHARDFAFFEAWEKALPKGSGDFSERLQEKKILPLLEALLTAKGLDYPAMPKGLLLFHRYGDQARTALEEHWVEAASLVRDATGLCRLHFTVAEAWKDRFASFTKEILPRYENSGLHFSVDFSLQKDSTKTLAVDLQNQPLRDANGQLVFRQAGHGALLANLQELNSDFVFIKNIDNVVPERALPRQILFKKALGGLCYELQKQVFHHLKALHHSPTDPDVLKSAWDFAASEPLRLVEKDVSSLDLAGQGNILLRLLDRPIRVCGMVPNQGEPGGGPFWVKDKRGEAGLQIIESSQVERESEAQQKIFRSATHFNSVDLVCGLKDHAGQNFKLQKFSDPKAGFISQKSKDGMALKALELPGLWNGAMSDWITVFVEVPPETFTPVKTVMDLLRREHQA